VRINTDVILGNVLVAPSNGVRPRQSRAADRLTRKSPVTDSVLLHYSNSGGFMHGLAAIATMPKEGCP